MSFWSGQQRGLRQGVRINRKENSGHDFGVVLNGKCNREARVEGGKKST